MKVHILVTCRKAELLPASTLVFKTLRTGFPTAHVTAWLNCAPDHDCGKVITEAMLAAKVDSYGWEPRQAITLPTTEHHRWINELIETEQEPFWICDTDISFWGKVQDWTFDAPLAGRLTPQFKCRFANAITRPRLHTCLMKIDPVRVRERVEKYGRQFPDAYCTPRPTLAELVWPRYVPWLNAAYSGRVNYFHDTCCLLYQAIGGQAFTPQQNESFDHMGSGTLSDLVAPCYPEHRLRESHFAIFENHELLKGAWRKQCEFYERNAA